MTQTKDGAVVSNTKMLEPGQEFSLHFVDGSAEAMVTKIHTMEEEQ